MDQKYKPKGERQLKVQPKHHKRTYSQVILPEIRLSGKWLLTNGFNCGELITVKYKKNKIILSTKK